ncbi:MAG TPA: hypothetical protein IAC04_05740 [Candidatus Coprenecus stercoravium]|uniref:Uncharacterized protein n=1 Tax=Candidatus Coprenecus stercoravium TaxID=2840735 RepID=A0A9D2KB55_9BACT|nr:hypothetical protein [Candidatus Coprenecus stercoravium]
MRTHNFIQWAIVLGTAAFLTASCQKQEQPGNPANGELSSVVLSIDLGQSATKATTVTPDDVWSDETEHSFSKIDVYFTDDNDVIKYVFRANSTDADGDGKTIYDNLTESNGVRFIGMSGITRVYVVADGPDIQGLDYTTSTVSSSVNISALSLALENYGPAINQTGEVPYIGGDIQLESATNVAGEDNEVIISEEGLGARYLSAKIYIRPVISRVEISKVALQANGTAYFAINEENSLIEPCATEDGADYKVTYEGFDATLTGVYMSNVYRKANLFPVPSDLTSWQLFSTPTFDAASAAAPILAGAWSALSGESGVNSVLCHTSYSEGTYGELVASDYQNTDGDKKNVFNGTNGTAIPFHFFYPYDATKEGEDATVISGAENPVLHFQFQPAGSASVTVTKVEKFDNSAWTEVSQTSEPSLYSSLASAVQFPAISSTGENVAYINVTGFAESVNGSALTSLKPGVIYKLGEVLVTPNFLSVSTQSTSATNIVVTVTVVDFTKQEVYPVFE